MKEIRLLIEDYKRRERTVNKMIERLRFKDYADPNYVRLKTKASCYRALLVELERSLSRDPNKLFLEFIDIHFAHLSDYYREELKKSFVEYLKNHD